VAGQKHRRPANVPRGPLNAERRSPGPLRPPLLGHPLAGDHRRIHRAGQNRVDTDPVGRMVHRHGDGQRVHGTLGARVGRLAPRAKLEESHEVWLFLPPLWAATPEISFRTTRFYSWALTRIPPSQGSSLMTPTRLGPPIPTFFCRMSGFP